uniref:Uncharacterized protein n=1 Tax=Anguilla anguilla TaxID=7936 RepID=A0A0E9R9E4_ANGAN
MFFCTLQYVIFRCMEMGQHFTNITIYDHKGNFTFT